MARSEQTTISCGGGVELVVQGENIAAFLANARTQFGKSGEALVEEVLQRAPGHIEVVTRRQDGKRHDNRDGIPAVRVFSTATGALTLACHYKNDLATDTATEPAFQQFDADTGRLLVKRHYESGRIQDTVDEPAVMMNYREDQVFYERYQNGQRCDGINGEAAVEVYTDGVLRGRQHYVDGQLNDSAEGECGYQRFNEKGKLVESFHCKAGIIQDKPRSRLKNFVARVLHRDH